jgi:hypothetical protein
LPDPLGSFIVVRCLHNLVEEEFLRDNHAMLQVGVEEILELIS